MSTKIETKSLWTGFLTLIEREFYRFGRLAGQTIGAPVVMTVLFVLIFGYSLGQQIENISGFSYITYILPGLAGMGVITNSYSNSSTSLFMARMDRSIENILVAPLSNVKIVFAFVVGGLLRGVLVGGITLLVAVALTGLKIQHPMVAAFYLVCLSVIFSALGIISALWAEDWDHLATFSNFVITPLTYLGGVFYSIKMLPPVWRKISILNPILYFIDGFRWTILGHADVPFAVAGGVTLGFAVLSVSAAVYLFRIGYKLIV